MLVVLIGILNNNHRLDDFKDLFRAELRRVEDTLHTGARRVEDTLRLEIQCVEESLLHKFAELDDRLIRLENRYGK